MGFSNLPRVLSNKGIEFTTNYHTSSVDCDFRKARSEAGFMHMAMQQGRVAQAKDFARNLQDHAVKCLVHRIAKRTLLMHRANLNHEYVIGLMYAYLVEANDVLYPKKNMEEENKKNSGAMQELQKTLRRLVFFADPKNTNKNSKPNAAAFRKFLTNSSEAAFLFLLKVPGYIKWRKVQDNAKKKAQGQRARRP